MKLKPGLSTVCTILRRELDKRFSCFLHPNDLAFQPTYTIATFLDLEHRIVLSNDQKRCQVCYLKPIERAYGEFKLASSDCQFTF